MLWSISLFRSPPSNSTLQRILVFAGEAVCGAQRRLDVRSQTLGVRNQRSQANLKRRLTTDKPLQLPFHVEAAAPQPTRLPQQVTANCSKTRRYLDGRAWIGGRSCENTILRLRRSHAKRNSNNSQARAYAAVG
jgi:hypothetical protein